MDDMDDAAFDEPLTPEQQEQIADLSAQQTEQISEQALMPSDPSVEFMDRGLDQRADRPRRELHNGKH